MELPNSKFYHKHEVEAQQTGHHEDHGPPATELQLLARHPVCEKHQVEGGHGDQHLVGVFDPVVQAAGERTDCAHVDRHGHIHQQQEFELDDRVAHRESQNEEGEAAGGKHGEVGQRPLAPRLHAFEQLSPAVSELWVRLDLMHRRGHQLDKRESHEAKDQ